MPGFLAWHITLLQHPLDTGVDEKATLPDDLANLTRREIVAAPSGPGKAA